MLTEQDFKLLREKYNARGHNNNWQENNLGFGFIHYAMIRNLRPEFVLVVGSQRGFVPAICAMACRDNAKGKVMFVDAGLSKDVTEDNQKLGEKSWGGLGIWKTATPEYWHESFRPFIELKVMTTEEYHKSLEDRPIGFDFDYVYLDGDHSYEGIRRDLKIAYDLSSPTAMITLHDVSVDKQTDWGECGVKRFWDDFPKMHKLTIPNDCGLGILQKEL